MGDDTQGPQDTLIGSVATDGSSAIRRLPDLTILHELPDCTNALAFSPDDSLALVSGNACSDGAAGEFLIGHALVAASPPLPPGPELSPTVDTADAEVPLPHLTTVLADVDMADVSMDEIFESGMRAFVAGIEALAEVSID